MAFIHHKPGPTKPTACGALARGGAILTTGSKSATTCPICRAALGLPRLARPAKTAPGRRAAPR